MKDVMGIIYTTKDDLSLRELTSNRSVAALPLAARYRLVDFVLSSLVNSNVRNVGVIMQRNYHSLMDHLGSGKEWDLHTRNNGLFILPPFLNRDNGGEYQGVLDALRANVDYLRRSRQEYVLLTGSHTVFNARFDDMFEAHERNHADVTVMYAKYDPLTFDYSASSHNGRCFLRIDENNVVRDIEIDPNVANYPAIALDVLLVKRTLLMHLVDQAFSHSHHDMYRDVLQPHVRTQTLNVLGYCFTGYHRRIETIRSYYSFNMDLLNSDVRRELFTQNPVYTKTRDEVPAKYLPGAKVCNSLIADGCQIEGTVENSILFRGVRVGKDTVIRDSILMQDDDIGDHCSLENVILDKDVTVRRSVTMMGAKQYPIVIGKNVTL